MKLKFVRKMLILSVLSVGLFFALGASSNNPSMAYGCCSDCDTSFQYCQQDCEARYPVGHPKYQPCLQEECFPPFFFCMSHCDPLC